MTAHEADRGIRDFDGFPFPNGCKLSVSLSRNSSESPQQFRRTVAAHSGNEEKGLVHISNDSFDFWLQSCVCVCVCTCVCMCVYLCVSILASRGTFHAPLGNAVAASRQMSSKANVCIPESDPALDKRNRKQVTTPTIVEEPTQTESDDEGLVVDFPDTDDLAYALGLTSQTDKRSSTVESHGREIRIGDTGQLRVTSVINACNLQGSLHVEGVTVSQNNFCLDGLTAAKETDNNHGGVMLLERLTVGKNLTATVTGKSTGAFLVKIEDVQTRKSVNEIVAGSRFVYRPDVQPIEPEPERRVAQSLSLSSPPPHLLPTPNTNRYYHRQMEVVKLPQGRLFHGVISFIVNPTMYIVVAEGDNDSRMRELSTQLTQYCLRVAQPMTRMPDVGEMVCACFSEDKCWYRATVLRHIDGKSSLVSFFDYGNRSIVQLNDIREILPEFLQLPAQALQCLLTEYKGTGIGGQFTDNAVGFLKSLRSLMVEYVPGSIKSNIHFIKLFDFTNPQNPVDVGHKMVQFRLAVPYRQALTQEVHGNPIGFGRGLPAVSVMNQQTPGVQTVVKTSELLMTRSPRPGMLLNSVSTHSLTYPTIPGDKFDIIITHIASPGLFWAQLADRALIESLCSLMDRMAVVCNASSRVAGFFPPIGSLCCARYSGDGSWYRASVNSVSHESVNVKFVDFGNDEITNVSEVRPIEEEYLQLPLQALKFGLHGSGGLQPVQRTTDQFRELCLNKKLHVTVREQLQGCLLVDLNDMSHEPPLNVISELHKRGKAAGHSMGTRTPPERQLSAPVSNPVSPTSSTMPSMSNRGSSPSTSVSHVSRKRQSVMADDLEQVHPPNTETFDIIVTTFESPECFYGQVANPVAMKRFADAFSSELNEHYSKRGSRIDSPVKGELCCAYFSDDESFYRAEILSFVSSAEVMVRYIDYGNTADVKLSNVYVLDAQFVSLPKQAMAFKLSGVEAPLREWSQRTIKICQEKTINQKKTCRHSYSVSGKFEVELFDSPSCDPPSMNQWLVNQKMATSNNPKNRKQADQRSVSVASVPRPATSVSSELSAGQVSRPTECQTLPSEQFVAVVTVVNSLDSFYIQVADPPLVRELADLLQSMNDHYSGVRQRPFIPVAGKMYAGKFSEDGRWYRAYVSSVEYEKRTATVAYPDFGNEETVPFTSLAVLADAFNEFPLQAVHCCLTGVESLGTEATSLMKREVIDKQVLVKRSLQDVENGRYSVDIIDLNSKRSVSSLLVHEGLAKSTDESACKPQQKVENYYLSEVGHALIPADGYFTLLITNVENPGCFWGQVAAKDTAEQLQQLTVDLTEYCHDILKEDIAFSPTKDELCCALFSSDDMWYRAAVENVDDDGTLTVRFVDFGNAERVAPNEVVPIPRTFLTLPLIAIQCQLAGIKPKSSIVWPADATHGFKLLVEDRKLVAKQINVYGSVFSVELYDTSTDVDVLINKELVAADLADLLTLSPVTKH